LAGSGCKAFSHFINSCVCVCGAFAAAGQKAAFIYSCLQPLRALARLRKRQRHNKVFCCAPLSRGQERKEESWPCKEDIVRALYNAPASQQQRIVPIDTFMVLAQQKSRVSFVPPPSSYIHFFWVSRIAPN